MSLAQGRSAYDARRWEEAFAQLAAGRDASGLCLTDLERLAVAANLAGHDDASIRAWTDLHRMALNESDTARALRAAFWAGFQLMNAGEFGPAMGWFARAERLLSGVEDDCPERGYLLLPAAIGLVEDGSYAEADTLFEDAYRYGERFDDADLRTMALHGRGRAQVRLGRRSAGLRLLDEVMVAVTTGEVSPVVAGDVYCGVIEGCYEAFDLRRAREWTAALDRWCDAQSGLVRYRGECRLYRSEVFLRSGAWDSALNEAKQAAELLGPQHPSRGGALYRQAEVLRLRGSAEQAAAAYQAASAAGSRPEPGLARLLLAQGKADEAVGMLRRALGEAADVTARVALLSADVEVRIATGDIENARASAMALVDLAADLEAPLLQATAVAAMGRVQLAEGAPEEALGLLRQAMALWGNLDDPYESARVRLLIAEACDGLGDRETAALEAAAAEQALRRLGAPAPERQALARPGVNLTNRQLEVLRLLAAGLPNRAIAESLGISEKTVARHVSNIFVKIDVGSRAAATAFAYTHDLA